MILIGDALTKLKTLSDGAVRCCVTSPPYWGLRDYGVESQMGLEPTVGEFIEGMVAVFRDVRRVLADDGTLWLNMGDSYAGSWGAQGRQGDSGHMAGRSVVSARQIEAHPKRQSRTGSLGKTPGLKPKDLCGIPWRVAMALQADGWYLRSDIIWSKPNPMPESVADRPTKSHEYLFLLSKSERYFYDADAIAVPATYAGRTVKTNGADGMVSERFGHETREGLKRGITVGETRNERTVWTIPTRPYPQAHFATYPIDLPVRCIKAGSAEGDTVLDPFLGSGTTAAAAVMLGRKYIGIELNPEYAKLAQDRIGQAERGSAYRDESKATDAPLFEEGVA